MTDQFGDGSEDAFDSPYGEQDDFQDESEQVMEEQQDAWSGLQIPPDKQERIEWAKKQFGDPIQAIEKLYESESKLGRLGSENQRLKQMNERLEQLQAQLNNLSNIAETPVDDGFDQEQRLADLQYGYERQWGLDPQVARKQAMDQIRREQQASQSTRSQEQKIAQLEQQLQANQAIMQFVPYMSKDPDFGPHNPDVVDLYNQNPNITVQTLWKLWQIEKGNVTPPPQVQAKRPAAAPSSIGKVPSQPASPARRQPNMSPEGLPLVQGMPVSLSMLNYWNGSKQFLLERYGKDKNGKSLSERQAFDNFVIQSRKRGIR